MKNLVSKPKDFTYSELKKSYKGSFNIRISPAIHKMAKRQTIMQGISLNRFIQQAVEQAVTYNAQQI